MPVNNQKIAENISALAKERGITVKQVLKDCKINPNFKYDLEHGSSPSIDKITRIAEYLGVSTARLLEGADGEVSALLVLYEKLSDSAKEELRAYMKSLIEE
ncbi:MAG: helix-turn-helix transcriptional regulator [Clostridia bacterium]|nr:helix-turn-helix transcriptional regulator [Clostridia bacterium]